MNNLLQRLVVRVLSVMTVMGACLVFKNEAEVLVRSSMMITMVVMYEYMGQESEKMYIT